MKKLLALFIVLTMILLGCGGGTKDSAKETKKAAPKVEVKKELMITLKIGEDELKFVKGSFLSAARTPGDDTTEYTLYGTQEGQDKSSLNIDFDSAVKEEQEVYLSLKQYEIIKASMTLETFEAKKHKVLNAKGTFNGQLKMEDENGFPTGDPIDFSGTFEMK